MLPRPLGKQLVQRGVDECIVVGMYPETCRVSPDRRDWPQFGIRHLRHFELIVADAKVKVGLGRDDGRIYRECFFPRAASAPALTSFCCAAQLLVAILTTADMPKGE